MEFDWGLEMGYLFLLLIALGMIIYNIILLRKKPAAIIQAIEPPLPPDFTNGTGAMGNG
ncbi:MAG: hypothetical protein M0D57_09995 [Sphingobacteriales bacterium JAD_PAG50586_3]|nr:MAG: hypothetical protein M0D57_09995 [Sphingobacteriales bacterium JAD_PAG50586_3]